VVLAYSFDLFWIAYGADFVANVFQHSLAHVFQVGVA
jgi:hypothetical protein